MKLVYPELNLKIDFEENCFCSLIVENQKLFYEFLCDLYLQMEGEKGKFVLSEDLAPVEMRKYAELVTQLVPFSMNRRELLTGLYGQLQKNALSENMIGRTYALLSEMERYIGDLTDSCSIDLDYDSATDITPLLKMFNLRFSADEDSSLCEKLLDFIEAAERYRGKRLFIIANFRSYADDREAQLFFDNALMRKARLLCLESSERCLLKNEKRRIIDQDLCVI